MIQRLLAVIVVLQRRRSRPSVATSLRVTVVLAAEVTRPTTTIVAKDHIESKVHFVEEAPVMEG